METKHTAVRRLQFCCGHRIVGHQGKCRHLHGHNYVVLLHAEAIEGLDDVGRVVDFSVLKNVVGTWIDDCWDHGMVLWKSDELAVRLQDWHLFEMRLYRLPTNPTAENMAEYLLYHFDGPLATYGVRLVKVELWETENCYAVAARSPVAAPTRNESTSSSAV